MNAEKPKPTVPCVLVVDDNEDFQQIHMVLLEKLGISVDAASNGREGLQLVLAHPDKYDLLLVDIEMPIMTGIELVKELKNIDFRGPIVAVSSRYDLRDKCTDIGFTDYLEKPLSVSDIRTVVKKYIKYKNVH
jgi:two-component system, sensor histidine kinase and response regulator